MAKTQTSYFKIGLAARALIVLSPKGGIPIISDQQVSCRGGGGVSLRTWQPPPPPTPPLRGLLARDFVEEAH